MAQHGSAMRSPHSLSSRHLRMQSTLKSLSETLLGRYEVGGQLGVGGMSTVFRARDLRHGREVAIKVMRSDASDPSGVERFLHEIGFTARLNHPHILPLLDSGRINVQHAASGRMLELPYYIMPLVAGESLRDRLERLGPLDSESALAFSADVADALAYAHAQGVLHRDVKPENILLTERHALVADFGVARAMTAASAQEERVTQVGLIVGTPAYMSPEQSVGDDSLDGRSDVYSLGIVLYECLTGATPFGGKSAQSIIAKRFTMDAPPLRERRPELSAVVESMVLRALRRDPTERYASAAEFADAIAAARERSLKASMATTGTVIAPLTPSIAVLPFDNQTAETENEYLSDGITDEILSVLSRIGGIRVCARTSCFSFKGQAIDVRQVGARLGVRTVLTGSVRRSGDRVRVNAELVDAQAGFRIWSDRFDGTMQDVFALEDQIAASISGALTTALTGGHSHPATPARAGGDAHELVLRGRHQLAQRTPLTLRSAVEHFDKAINSAPEYAAAHAGHAEALALLGVYGVLTPDAAMPRARESATRALELEPDRADALAVLGVVHAAYDWDWASAQQSLTAAVAASTHYPAPHQWLATNVLVPLGRTDDALDAVAHAMRLDPLSAAVTASHSIVLFYGRRYGAAIDSARALLDREPSFALAHFFIGQAYSVLGEHEAATAACATAAALSQDSVESLSLLGHVLARAGDAERARGILARLQQQAAESYVAPSHLALIHVGLGEHEQALDCLEDAMRLRAADLIWLGVRPAWDPLRNSPRYAQLVEVMGLQGESPT